MTQGDDVTEIRLAILDQVIDQYEKDPDSLDDELRGLIEAYLALTQDVYGS